jgi:hypothetical protein
MRSGLLHGIKKSNFQLTGTEKLKKNKSIYTKLLSLRPKSQDQYNLMKK